MPTQRIFGIKTLNKRTGFQDGHSKVVPVGNKYAPVRNKYAPASNKCAPIWNK